MVFKQFSFGLILLRLNFEILQFLGKILTVPSRENIPSPRGLTLPLAAPLLNSANNSLSAFQKYRVLPGLENA